MMNAEPHCARNTGHKNAAAKRKAESVCTWSGLLIWISLCFEYSMSQIHCPTLCRCEDTTMTVDCSSINTSQVPYGIDASQTHTLLHKLTWQTNTTLPSVEEVIVLHLDNKNGLPADSLNMTDTLILNLSNNHITRITPQTFAALTNLQSLDISFNNITEISDKLFQNTVSLVSLNMSHNHISHITTGALNSMTEIIQLDISFNPLKSLPAHIFRNLTNLELLSLAATQLSVLRSSYFAYTPQLASVDLSFNNIALVNKATVDSVSSLVRLQRFNLLHNPLQCTCRLKDLRNWLVDNGTTTQTMATCAVPRHHKGQRLVDIAPSELRCVVSKQQAKVKTTLSYYDNRPTEGPLVYNPQLGWYTGGVLSAMLLCFLLCVGIDRIKRHLIKLYKKKRLKRLKLKYKRERANDSGEGGLDIDGDVESLTSYHTNSITPAAVTAAFHEQYLSIINYNHQLQSACNLQQQQQQQLPGGDRNHRSIHAAGPSLSPEGVPGCASRSDLDSSRLELSKEDTAARNLIDSSKLRQEKVSSKQRIECTQRGDKSTAAVTSSSMDMPRTSTSCDEDVNDINLGVQVLEIHPDCPIHNPAANSNYRTRYQAAL